MREHHLNLRVEKEQRVRMSIGSLVGATSAVISASIGLWLSWLGFSSEPYTSQDLGLYCASVGAILGLSGVALVFAVSRLSNVRKSETVA